MKRKILAVFLCCILLLTLSACGTKSKETGKEQDKETVSENEKVSENKTEKETQSTQPTEEISADDSTASEPATKPKSNDEGNNGNNQPVNANTNTGSQSGQGSGSNGSSGNSSAGSQTGGGSGNQNTGSGNQTPQNVAVSSVKLSQTSATLEVGKSVTLSATISPSNATNKNVTWKSSSGAVTVSNGKVTAKSAGTATVTATAGGKSASCTVTVKAPVQTINISYWESFAKTEGLNAGLKWDSTATACWDNPIGIIANDAVNERNIKDAIKFYARQSDIEYFCIWSEKRSDGNYNLYIGYA